MSNKCLSSTLHMNGAYPQLPWISLDSMSAMCHCKQRNHKQNVQKQREAKTEKGTLSGTVHELKQESPSEACAICSDSGFLSM